MEEQTKSPGKSAAETGHVKNAANFNLLIIAVHQMGSSYQPGNQLIALASLQQKAQLIMAAMDTWTTAKREASEAENRRKMLFGLLKPYATRIFNTLQSSMNVQQLTLDDARGILNKIAGKRASGKTKTALAEAAMLKGDAAPTIRSASHTGYDQQVSHFADLCILIKGQPTYLPNELDLTVESIVDFDANIRNANQKVGDTAGKLIDARNERDLHLYADAVGALDLAILVKSYIRGKSGPKDPQYKKVSGVKFSRPSKRKGQLK